MKKTKLDKGYLCEDKDKQYCIVYYLALFNSYVVRYSHRYYVSNDETKYQIFGNEPTHSPKSISLGTINEVKDFCDKNDITILCTDNIDHPLAHGLYDCRSIH